MVTIKQLISLAVPKLPPVHITYPTNLVGVTVLWPDSLTLIDLEDQHEFEVWFRKEGSTWRYVSANMIS